MDKKYLFVTISLVVLVLAGAIFIFANKNSANNQSYSTSTPSATITPTVEPTATYSAKTQTMKDGLQIQDEVVGTGEEAVSGKSVTVNYTGTLTDGTKFDSSYDHGQPFVFSLGAGQVIQGWDEGVVGMKVGGKRKLTIPPSLGYGDAGIAGAIPGGATLIFEVELLKVE